MDHNFRSYVYFANSQRLAVASEVMAGSGRNDRSMKTLPGNTARIRELRIAISRSHIKSISLYRNIIPSNPKRIEIDLPTQSCFPVIVYMIAAMYVTV